MFDNYSVKRRDNGSNRKIPNYVKRMLISSMRRAWLFHCPERKKVSKLPNECRKCKKIVTMTNIDHIIPVGKEPQTWSEFGEYLSKLFCPKENLQKVCASCHNNKTKIERKK